MSKMRQKNKKPVYVHAICPTCRKPYDWSKEDLCCNNTAMILYESTNKKFAAEVMFEYVKMNDNKIKNWRLQEYV